MNYSKFEVTNIEGLWWDDVTKRWVSKPNRKHGASTHAFLGTNKSMALRKFRKWSKVNPHRWYLMELVFEKKRNKVKRLGIYDWEYSDQTTFGCLR